MSKSKFSSHEDARRGGHHSRRNESRGAQDAARQAYFKKPRNAAKLARKARQQSTSHESG